jgi:peroxiredoxin family protein
MHVIERKREEAMAETINFVVFSGTDDKLQALAVMTAGAAALGKNVNIFLQYWGLRAFTRAAIDADHGLAAEAGDDGRAAVDALAAAGQATWADTLRMAKELGEVDIQACSLSMDVLRIDESELSDLVDGVQGVTAFYLNAEDGHILFI